jgi:hypothetical protein
MCDLLVGDHRNLIATPLQDSFRFIKACASDTAASGIHVCFQYNNDGLLMGEGNRRLAIYPFLLVNTKKELKIKETPTFHYCILPQKSRSLMSRPSLNMEYCVRLCLLSLHADVRPHTRLSDSVTDPEFLNSTNWISTTGVMQAC